MIRVYEVNPLPQKNSDQLFEFTLLMNWEEWSNFVHDYFNDKEMGNFEGFGWEKWRDDRAFAYELVDGFPFIHFYAMEIH